MNEILRLWLCSSPLQMHFAVACVARGSTVTEPTSPASFLEGGGGSGVRRYGGLGTRGSDG